jgi:hypothetical protein
LLQWLAGPYLDSEKPTCRDNLRHIDWAKDDWAVKHRVTSGESEPQAAELYGRRKYWRWAPECPQGGNYTIGNMSEKPRCSLPEHGSDYGDVFVCDESGQPLGGVTVFVRGEAYLTNALPWEFRSVATGTNGLSHVTFNILRAHDLVAFKSGYTTSSVPLMMKWPVKLVLRRQVRLNSVFAQPTELEN